MFTQLNGLDIKKGGAPKTTAKQKQPPSLFSPKIRSHIVTQVSLGFIASSFCIHECTHVHYGRFM